MLDGTQLCSPEILDVLTKSIPADERVAARQVYEITVKARNAFAHGAVTRLGEDELDCVGHLVVKSVQALVGAGRHSMTKVAAYYRWKNGHKPILRIGSQVKMKCSTPSTGTRPGKAPSGSKCRRLEDNLRHCFQDVYGGRSPIRKEMRASCVRNFRHSLILH